MKLNSENSQVALTGMAEEATGFKIEANAKAFRALSSTLYKDQIGSVLREVVCNGMDANKVSGSSLPVEVKLPNEINPTFYVRDTGPGLSEERVKDLYTTYFASTKDQSNDQIGAFGLGSKSPFAYTDSFTVVSAHGGMKKTYAAFLSEAGNPSILKVAEEPVDASWEHGLEVGFPVKPRDFLEFERKALEQLVWLNPVPRLTGTTMVLKNPEVTWQFGDFKGVTGSLIPQGLAILMGGVAYPLTRPDLMAVLAKTKQKTMPNLQGNVCLEIPLGSVEVALSRESLSMTDYTVDSLARIVDANTDAFEKAIAEETGKARSRSVCATWDSLKEKGLPSFARLVSSCGIWNYRPTDPAKALAFPEGIFLGATVGNLLWMFGEQGFRLNTIFAKKTTTSGFILEADAPDPYLFKDGWERILWVVNDSGLKEPDVRQRLRQTLKSADPDKLAVVLEPTGQNNPDLTGLEAQLGVSVLRLSQVVLPKKPVKGAGETISARDFGPVALLGDRRKLDSRFSPKYGDFDVQVSNTGLPELQEGEVGYVLHLDLSALHRFNSTAPRVVGKLAGLNTALARFGVPKADSLYAVHSKKDLKKAVSLGYQEFLPILARTVPEVPAGLASYHLRSAVEARFRVALGHDPHRALGDTGAAVLDEVFRKFPETRSLLAGTWIRRDLDVLFSENFVAEQADFLCLFNLCQVLLSTAVAGPLPADKDITQSRWGLQEDLFRKLDLPELWNLAQVPFLDTGRPRESLEALLVLLRHKPEPRLQTLALAS